MLEEDKMCSDVADVWTDVAAACRLIPPLWDLSNYVAVNPFLGFAATPIDQAAREVGDGLGARLLPGVSYYRDRWEAGDFGPSDLARAAERQGCDGMAVEAVMNGLGDVAMRSVQSTPTYAQHHDRRYGGEWEDVLVRHISRWCAVYASGGGSYWKLPDVAAQGLYSSWRDAARVDRSLEIMGLRGWRRWASGLPDRPAEALLMMLARRGVSSAERPTYLYHLLGGVYGWASYFRRESWIQGGEDAGLLTELLAIRVCADAAVDELAAQPRVAPQSISVVDQDVEVEDESSRLVFQEALEDGFARRLLGGLNPPAPPSRSRRPEVQAVFCIDVRAEAFRRHLESQSGDVDTLGFAGFFGISLDWQADGSLHSARCPALLRPTVVARPLTARPTDSIGAVAKQLQGATAAAINYVEVLGLAYGLALAADFLKVRPWKRSDEKTSPIALEADIPGEAAPLQVREALAANLLKYSGLGTTLARLVLLCGHEGRSTNNPHAAGLNCGACGGHGGAVNARIAAALLNDPEVRAGLQGRGLEIPADTHFVAGLHDTSIDEVTLLDADRIPPTHAKDLAALRIQLERAGALTRAERASALGLADGPPGFLDRVLRGRSRDWSEVRPEWGLARNAAFIAARRERTREVDLQGRAFLHEYDATRDPDGAILTLILNAPMVVASWINLQYFASTVDNTFFGCGTKTLHNRVGSLGVVLGNGGDLRTGLASQSVHGADGRWFHEPLRLQVVIEAPQAKIDDVLNAHKAVRDLVENGWLRLFALEADGSRTSLRLPNGSWEPFLDDEPAPLITPARPERSWRG